MKDAFESLELSHLFIPPDKVNYFAKACFCSEFFKNSLISLNQNALDDFIQRIDYAKTIDCLHADELKQLELANISDEDFKYALRTWRNFNQMFIIFMDCNQFWSLEQVLMATSKMADIAIDVAHRYSHAVTTIRFGVASSKADNIENTLSVLAMGKLGAFELNLSSDIDLIFVYPFSGNTIINNDQQKSISNQEYFTKVARKIIDCLHQVTQNGFVYRVDMRLRPWGQGGELVLNQTAFFKYYLEHGRDWERFAMVKMRPVCGDEIFNEAVLELINQFVYRAYVDFQAIQSLRDLKNQINKESSKLSSLNVKLGRGGIREIEFIVQSFQLVRGGNIISLQTPNLFDVLALLEHHDLLDETSILQLKDAYIWLRKIEHGIQAYQDKQGQILPESDGLQLKLANYVGLQSTEQLLEVLEMQTKIVSSHFENCIQKENQTFTLDSNIKNQCAKALFNESNQITISQDNAAFNEMLLSFINQNQIRKLTEQVQKRLLDCLTYIVQEILKFPNEQQCSVLGDMILIVESVLRRSSYLTLLNEHPFAIFEMVKLVSRSKWVTNQLIERPFLFDELIDRDRLYHLPSEQELGAQLRLSTLRIEQDDLEQQMESLRQFKHARVFRAAVCEVMQTLELTKVSDYLTQVANVVVNYSLHLAKENMIERFGSPDVKDNSQEDLSVIAYGKMGGFELNYHSDLDIIFIYNSSMQGKTDGVKSVENIVFYTKVVQRFMHILNSKTYNGQLYEVDMRLRPSGNSGSLVSAYEGFKKYQLNQAWTWEHQALVRTRCVAGMSNAQYLELKKAILTTVNKQDLLKNIIEMRNKMLDQLGTKSADSDQFNIKHDRGGLVDIEFMVQYWVLNNCESIVELTQYSDNLNILKCLAINDVISTEDAKQLSQSYITLRALLHKRILNNQKIQINDLTEHKKIAKTVKNIEAFWIKFMLSCAP